jgi:hypothetical protein
LVVSGLCRERESECERESCGGGGQMVFLIALYQKRPDNRAWIVDIHIFRTMPKFRPPRKSSRFWQKKTFSCFSTGYRAANRLFVLTIDMLTNVRK